MKSTFVVIRQHERGLAREEYKDFPSLAEDEIGQNGIPEEDYGLVQDFCEQSEQGQYCVVMKNGVIFATIYNATEEWLFE